MYNTRNAVCDAIRSAYNTVEGGLFSPEVTAIFKIKYEVRERLSYKINTDFVALKVAEELVINAKRK